MDTLREIVHRVIKEYAVDGANFVSSLTIRPDGNLFTVVDFAVDNKGRRFVATSIVTELVGNYIVIEYDDNDKPLVDALVQAGIPREQIILTYAGESLQEISPSR